MDNTNFDEVDLAGELEDTECRFCEFLPVCIDLLCMKEMEEEKETDRQYFEEDGMKVLFK